MCHAHNFQYFYEIIVKIHQTNQLGISIIIIRVPIKAM